MLYIVNTIIKLITCWPFDILIIILLFKKTLIGLFDSITKNIPNAIKAYENKNKEEYTASLKEQFINEINKVVNNKSPQ
jgi:hypothetical protein